MASMIRAAGSIQQRIRCRGWWLVLVALGCDADPARGPVAVSQSGNGNSLNTAFDPGFTQTAPNAANSIQVTFSGETLGVNGLPFNPVNPGDPVFVDGWNVTFDQILVVVGNIRLTANATAAQDPRVLGKVVAQLSGPYVLDMHQPKGFVGADGTEPAGGLFVWMGQDNGQSFDTSARYGFSYDTLAATYPATQVNLRANQFADYDLMVQNGWCKYITGTATYVGGGTYPDAAVQAKFAALPQTVNFSLGLTGASEVLNCINPTLGDGDPDDLANRGIQTNNNGAVYAQITLHTDHAFWDKLKLEGTPLRFDPIAAWAPTDGSVLPLNTLAASLATTFADGTPLPDRAPFQNVPGGYQTNQGNPNQVVLGLNGVPPTVVRNMADFMAFSAQSQMHLNADGLCTIVGQNAEDPWYIPSLP